MRRQRASRCPCSVDEGAVYQPLETLQDGLPDGMARTRRAVGLHGLVICRMAGRLIPGGWMSRSSSRGTGSQPPGLSRMQFYRGG